MSVFLLGNAQGTRYYRVQDLDLALFESDRGSLVIAIFIADRAHD